MKSPNPKSEPLEESQDIRHNSEFRPDVTRQGQVRLCVICGARVRNINPKTKTCSPHCTSVLHGRQQKERPVQMCQHCSKPTSEREGTVCDECYNQYTPGMLADLEG